MSALRLVPVFLLGGLELWGAIPAGLALGLPAWVVGVVAGLGAVTGTVLAALLGERVRRWLVARRPPRPGPPSRARRIWDRYGVVGLGLLAPLVTGAPLGVALGISLGAAPRRMLVWGLVGAVLWTAGLTAIGAAGKALL